jgi:hypothetical protein
MIKIYQKIEGALLRIIEKLENQRMTFGGWLLSFLAIVFLRNFLEALSTGLDYFQLGGDLHFVSFLFFHTPAFFLLGTLFFILLLYFLTKEISKKHSS